MVPYVATTEDITVPVRPAYLDQPSDFFSKRFVFFGTPLKKLQIWA